MIEPSAKPAKREDSPEKKVTTPPEPKTPSAEEQMESFENALKETDWGHQPC